MYSCIKSIINRYVGNNKNLHSGSQLRQLYLLFLYFHPFRHLHLLFLLRRLYLHSLLPVHCLYLLLLYVHQPETLNLSQRVLLRRVKHYPRFVTF